MRDPISKLAILDVDAVDVSIRKALPEVFVPRPHFIPVIYYAGRFTKKTKFGFTEKQSRIMILTSTHVLTYQQDGRPSRAIPISSIEEILIFPDSCNILRCPTEHDFVFSLDIPAEVDYLVNILQVTKRYYEPEPSKRMLSIKGMEGSWSQYPKLNLSHNGDAATTSAAAQVPMMRAVDQRSDAVDIFLRPPRPPKPTASNEPVVKSIDSRIGAVLSHPLFHPPDSSAYYGRGLLLGSSSGAGASTPSSPSPLIAAQLRKEQQERQQLEPATKATATTPPREENPMTPLDKPADTITNSEKSVVAGDGSKGEKSNNGNEKEAKKQRKMKNAASTEGLDEKSEQKPSEATEKNYNKEAGKSANKSETNSVTTAVLPPPQPTVSNTSQLPPMDPILKEQFELFLKFQQQKEKSIVPPVVELPPPSHSFNPSPSRNNLKGGLTGTLTGVPPPPPPRRAMYQDPSLSIIRGSGMSPASNIAGSNYSHQPPSADYNSPAPRHAGKEDFAAAQYPMSSNYYNHSVAAAHHEKFSAAPVVPLSMTPQRQPVSQLELTFSQSPLPQRIVLREHAIAQRQTAAAEAMSSGRKGVAATLLIAELQDELTDLLNMQAVDRAALAAEELRNKEQKETLERLAKLQEEQRLKAAAEQQRLEEEEEEDEEEEEEKVSERETSHERGRAVPSNINEVLNRPSIGSLPPNWQNNMQPYPQMSMYGASLPPTAGGANPFYSQYQTPFPSTQLPTPEQQVYARWYYSQYAPALEAQQRLALQQQQQLSHSYGQLGTSSFSNNQSMNYGRTAGAVYPSATYGRH